MLHADAGARFGVWGLGFGVAQMAGPCRQSSRSIFSRACGDQTCPCLRSAATSRAPCSSRAVAVLLGWTAGRVELRGFVCVVGECHHEPATSEGEGGGMCNTGGNQGEG